MIPDFTWPIFAIGCIGALAPEIIRLYNLRNEQELSWSWFYVIISFVFMLLGGVIAWILPATSYWGAFYVGVSTPVVVTTIIKDRKHRGIPKKTMEQKKRELAEWKKDGAAGGMISSSPYSDIAVSIGRTVAKGITNLRRNFFNAI